VQSEAASLQEPGNVAPQTRRIIRRKDSVRPISGARSVPRTTTPCVRPFRTSFLTCSESSP